MKTNKGIIGLGLILAIVLGIAVVGGGAYYLGKGSNKLEVKTPENVLPNNEDQNIPVVENQKTNTTPQVVAKCNSNSPSAIKLISPNGGEVYKAGDKITVKWESCNVDKDSVSIALIKHGPSSLYSQREWIDDYAGFTLGGIDPYKGVVDDGIHEITLPLSTDSNLISGQHYFISINGGGDKTKVGSGYHPSDYSDGLFTINSATKTISTADSNIIKQTGCGVSFSKASNWSVISNTNNETKLDILPNEQRTGFSGIDIKCVLSNSITDTDAKFGNITYFYDTGKKAWMETDNREGEGIEPYTTPVLAKPLFTTADGFPVFKGTGRWLTYIIPISTSSILYLHEGDTEGGYTQTLTNLVKTIKKL
jgi:hypothetical protein